MAFPKDSAIIILRAASDGYFLQIWQWDESPPPIPQNVAMVIDQQAFKAPTFRDDRSSTTKTEVKGEFETWIDNLFDQ